MKPSLIALCLATSLLGGCAVPSVSPTATDTRREAVLPHDLTLPTGYDTDTAQKFPLLIFLHGSGERGSDLEKVKVHGPPKLVAAGRALPFIVVSPQLAAGARWDPKALDRLLDSLLARLRIDESRIYLTGLSLGGHGTWAWAAARPERFAAIAPVCAWGDVAQACQIKQVPVWAFHGAADSVVPLAEGQKMVDAVQACGAAVQFTVYPGVDHDSWTRTYDNPQLYAWLLQQRRRDQAGK